MGLSYELSYEFWLSCLINLAHVLGRVVTWSKCQDGNNTAGRVYNVAVVLDRNPCVGQALRYTTSVLW